jgi:hypothetical protein
MKKSTLLLLVSFYYFCAHGQTSRIITDYRGYWSSTTASPNPVRPDTSHMLLGFTHDGVTYSTGANDGILIGNGVSFSAGDWRAFPVADILGNYGSGAGGGVSCYIALASKVDRSPSKGNVPAVGNYNIKNALIDGVKGLDLGTGVTNLPQSAIMNFRIFDIDATKIGDNEPDILLTQIADPSTTDSDVFSLIDESGNQIGNTFSQNMSSLLSFGTYTVDLFNLTPNTPYNAAKVYSVFEAHNDPTGNQRTRPMRVVAIKLSAFGITAANADQVAALRITPSGISDYAFIAYNANSISLSPNISPNPPLTNTSICDNGTAHFSVVATAAEGGTLSYAWQESIDGGNTWNPVTDGGNYAGASTARLAVTDPGNGYRYRVTVSEAGNPNPATSTDYQVTVISDPTAPTGVTIAGGGTVCAGTPIQLTSNVTGGSNLFYEWQVDPGTGTYEAIPNANLSTFVPPVGQTGSANYRLRISSGSACLPEILSNTQVIAINGIASVTPDERCGPGTVNLSATATSGTINWYSADVGGTSLASGPAYSSAPAHTTIYYVSSSVCPNALRVPVTATVNPASTGGTVSGSALVTPGTNNTTLTLAGYTGNVTNWQSSTDGFVSDIVNIASTSNQLTVTNLSETTQFRARVQSGTCAPDFSAAATINMSAPLPIRIGSFKANTEKNGIRVNWTAYNQGNTVRFEIERSTDGHRFNKVATLPVTTTEGDVKYEWLDEQPVQGHNYYRIKEVYVSGSHEYSSSVYAIFDNRTNGISVFPNPLVNNQCNLEFKNMSAVKYFVNMINQSGQVVYKTTIAHDGTLRNHKLNIPAVLSRGVYRLIITNTGSSVSSSTSVIIP